MNYITIFYIYIRNLALNKRFTTGHSLRLVLVKSFTIIQKDNCGTSKFKFRLQICADDAQLLADEQQIRADEVQKLVADMQINRVSVQFEAVEVKTDRDKVQKLTDEVQK